MEDVRLMQGRIELDAPALFGEAVARTGFRLTSTTREGQLRVTPYLFVTKAPAGTSVLAATIWLEGPGIERWSGRFAYQLPQTFTVASFSQMDAATAASIRQEVARGYEALLRRIESDRPDVITGERKVRFKADVAPTFGYEMVGAVMTTEPGITWLRSPLGVTAARTGVQLTPRD